MGEPPHLIDTASRSSFEGTGLISTHENWVWSNWANTHTCKPKYFHQPSNLEEIQKIIKIAVLRGKKLKVAGAGHSPSDIVCTKDHLVNLDRFNRILRVDEETFSVTVWCFQILLMPQVEGGIRLFELNRELPKYGLALCNLGSISDQSIAGALSTGTHGTGANYGIFATHVTSIELLTATGDIIYTSRIENPRIFSAIQCGLGCLGIIGICFEIISPSTVTVTIVCEPSFHIHSVESPIDLEDILNNLNHISDAEHFRIFWFPPTNKCQMWKANRTQKPQTTTPSILWQWLHKILTYYIFQFFLWLALLVPFILPWIATLWYWLLFSTKKEKIVMSYEAFNFDCLFQQHVNEWAIPLGHFKDAMAGLKQLIEENKFQVHFPVEVRFAKKDDIMLSPCYGRDSVFVGIIMYKPFGYSVEFKDYFAKFQTLMMKFEGRPHWGKEFTLYSNDLENMYPKWEEFRQVREQLDPNKLFDNEFLRRLFN